MVTTIMVQVVIIPTVIEFSSFIIYVLTQHTKSRDSSVGIATGYGWTTRGAGVRVPVWTKMFTSPYRPDRLWGPPNLL
jgi:hypothetical protein